MAHPVAPSHVSALMSGVVIKMGIYGLMRVTLDLLGGGPAWWGGAVLIVGTVSALLGVLYALMEHDLKRLLAYHSVENIGIILIGVGAGLVFQHYGLMTLAALGFIGGLYHTINHASFKGLLFLGAGSVLHGTRTRNMEEMGGLIKRMPWTALFFLIGSAAISALPPLNGFASEWIVFQVLLGGFNIPVPEIAALMPVVVGMLALTSGLAAACFVKAFGITFLAIPRSHEAEHAHESPLSMRLGMGLCLREIDDEWEVLGHIRKWCRNQHLSAQRPDGEVQPEHVPHVTSERARTSPSGRCADKRQTLLDKCPRLSPHWGCSSSLALWPWRSGVCESIANSA